MKNDLKNNSHPYIVDYMFCSSCEARMGIVESEYSQTLKKSGVNAYPTVTLPYLGHS